MARLHCTGEKCVTCGKGFSRLNALQKHCQKVHNMKKGDPGYSKGRRHQDQGLEEVEMAVCESQGGAQGEEAGQEEGQGAGEAEMVVCEPFLPCFLDGDVEMEDSELQGGPQGVEVGHKEGQSAEEVELPSNPTFDEVMKGLEEQDRERARKDKVEKGKKGKEKEKGEKGKAKEKGEKGKERAENGWGDPRDFALPIKRREQRFAVSECQNSPRWDRHILEKDLFLTPSPVVNPQGYQTLDDSNTGLVSSESVSEEGAAPAGDCNPSGSMEPEVLQSSGAQLAFSPGFENFVESMADVSLCFCEKGAAPAEDCNTSGSKEPEVLQSSGVQLPSSPALEGLEGPEVLQSVDAELPSSPPADCNTSGSSEYTTKDKLGRFFVSFNIAFSVPGVKYLSKKAPGFLELWKEFEPRHNRPLQVLRQNSDVKPGQKENESWTSPGDVLSIEEVMSLLTYFDNPEDITKADVHVWVNNDSRFRALFQGWCRSEDCGGEEAILFRHFKAFLNRKKLPKKLNEMLKETWPPGEKVNEKSLARRLENSEKFQTAWGYLKDLRGDDAKEVLKKLLQH